MHIFNFIALLMHVIHSLHDLVDTPIQLRKIERISSESRKSKFGFEESVYC